MNGYIHTCSAYMHTHMQRIYTYEDNNNGNARYVLNKIPTHNLPAPRHRCYLLLILEIQFHIPIFHKGLRFKKIQITWDALIVIRGFPFFSSYCTESSLFQVFQNVTSRCYGPTDHCPSHITDFLQSPGKSI